MSAKPSIVPTWNTDATNRVAPTGGQRATGYATNAIPTSGNLNHEYNLYGAWLQYLNDGDLEGDVSITGELAVGALLEVAGPASVQGSLEVLPSPSVFADFTYTADNTTDTLTATGHGRQTGEGPARTTNSGGGLPGGLAAGTDYYFISTGGNTFQLALTRDDALLGVFIDITSNGTGTQTMIDQPTTTVPNDATVSRDINVAGNATVGVSLAVTGPITANGGASFAAGTQVALGDSIVSHGNRDKAVSAINAAMGQTGWAAQQTSNAWYAISTANATLPVAVDFIVGDRIRSVSFKVFGNGTADLTTTILSIDSTMNATSIGTDTTNNISAAWSTITIDVTDTEIDSLCSVVIQFAANAAGIQIGNISAIYDHPPP